MRYIAAVLVAGVVLGSAPDARSATGPDATLPRSRQAPAPETCEPLGLPELLIADSGKEVFPLEPFEPTVFCYRAPGEGILAVAIRARGEADLVLTVTDGWRQPLPGGETDSDLYSVLGAEQLAVVIPEQGVYFVLVESYFTKGEFTINGGFFEIEGAVPGELGKWRNPRAAESLRINEQRSVVLEPSDTWHWWKLENALDTVLRVTIAAVVTEMSSGDIVLEGYKEGAGEDRAEFLIYDEYSDDDRFDDPGNESISVAINPNASIYVRVRPYTDFVSDPIEYTISATPER